MYSSTRADRMLRICGGALLAASCFAAHANEPSATSTSCSIVAFVDETDPAGLNVRAAPSAKARVLGTLPPVWVDKDSGSRVRIRVEVMEGSNGWFRIRNARDDEDLTGIAARPTFGGEGWVSGRKLVVKSQARQGHADPAEDSAVLLRLNEQQIFDGSLMVRASSLVACHGRWAQLEFSDRRLPEPDLKALDLAPAARAGLPRGRFRLWVDKICGSQETSCDGL
ncbi:SH3 domain-containing protein [Roseateles sp. DAIF2]|uniref:SH3 domain-containing protein n=1 Tax=Roseateles sp. DAIF2 TaxID=2714952 RepID=UPI0018A29662|nr:SH3 domain-containing protein [Roseateles sp. DAIF2]QPF71953.1 SH3 domain-containing protein [Roseateles sp. DAIF2]